MYGTLYFISEVVRFVIHIKKLARVLLVKIDMYVRVEGELWL